jgi:hypothetical protein
MSSKSAGTDALSEADASKETSRILASHKAKRNCSVCRRYTSSLSGTCPRCSKATEY